MDLPSFENLPFCDFLNNPAFDKVSQLIALFEKTQFALQALQEKPDERKLIAVKAGTVLTLTVLRKYLSGQSPKEYTQDDWAEVVDSVIEYAVIMDGFVYSEFVFTMYGYFIHASADGLSDAVSEDTVLAIHDLADSLRLNAELLHTGETTETSYIENCLWICMEAMVKLLSAHISGSVQAVLGEEFAVLSDSVFSFAFEYGRLLLYRKEQQLLAEMIEEQNRLSAELEIKYNRYIEELDFCSKEFHALIAHAFDPDFSTQLRSSVALAEAAGVSQENILDSIDKIDSFFMN